jgi:S-adenosylmethionine:tRNA ribosyltransferase-isomerase
VRVADFDFDLPAHLIAQAPPAERGMSRLLRLGRADGVVTHHAFGDLPGLLQRGDLLVVNDTRVFPARLIGHRLPGGGAAECFLVTRGDDPDTWVALVHPGQRLPPGSRMVFERDGHRLEAEVLSQHHHGRRLVRLHAAGGGMVMDAIHAIGHVPLPPYVKRKDTAADRERYQTVYARREGSIAAPTAGLHFTPAILDALTDAGVERATITHHVGYGTFQPIRTEDVEAHTMEAEAFEVDAEAAAALTRARHDARRVIAVGTTTTRALESLTIQPDGTVLGQHGDTSLFIHPGHRFQLVEGLITNFHLPKSSLVMLVAAFAGREHVLAAYREAVASRYRFYSYGDAMLIL